MSDRVLVTGGTGFIGSALVRHLLTDGYRVRVLDDDSRGSTHRLADIAHHIDLVAGDVRDRESVERATRGCEVVAHLAYVNGTEFFYSKPDLVLDVAVKGTMNVIDTAIRHDVRDFWFVSSSEVYQTPPSIPTDETVPLSVPDPLNPRYSYGGGKIMGELMVINYGRAHFERAVVVRPHNVFGPDMGTEHVIPQLIGKVQALALEGTATIDLPIQGDGTQTRAFIYIDDFIEGSMTAFTRCESPGIVHVGTDDERTIAEVAQAVVMQFGLRVRLVPGVAPPGATLRRCPDITKLRSLGFEPQVTFERGLERTVQWYRHRGNL